MARPVFWLSATLMAPVYGFISNTSHPKPPLYSITRDCVFARLSASKSPESTEASLAVGFDVAATSLAGSDPDRPQKVNQDAYFTFDTPGMCGIGVMDGHGLKGHELNDYLRERLPMRIEEQINNGGKIPNESEEIMNRFLNSMRRSNQTEIEGSDGDNDSAGQVRTIMENAFHLAHVDALEAKGIPAARSGTTCVVAAVSEDNLLYTATVGDSRGIIVEGVPPVPKSLAVETTIKIPHERTRVEAAEGRVDNLGNIFYGPMGIAMTRSLGNGVMLRAGVLPTPIVEAHGRLDTESTVILGTDGIFDVLSNECVAEHLLHKSTSLQQSVTTLCEKARARWQGNLPMEGKIDDITAIALRRKT